MKKIQKLKGCPCGVCDIGVELHGRQFEPLPYHRSQLVAWDAGRIGVTIFCSMPPFGAGHALQDPFEGLSPIRDLVDLDPAVFDHLHRSWSFSSCYAQLPDSISGCVMAAIF